MPNTTWSPTDKTASVTLSGGNLVATSSTANQGGRAVDRQSTGKFYWEITCNTFANGSSGIGVANASAVLTSMGATPLNACLIYPSGAVWLNNVNTSVGLSAITAGMVICIALDLVNLTIWFRKTVGNWNASGTANPATNTGGIACGSILGGVKNAFAAYALNASSERVTANFGDSAFAGAVPSGFTAGLPQPFIDLTGNLGGSSSYGKLKYGLKKYSRINAFAPIFAADVTVTPVLNLSGDLAPTIVFAANLDGGHGRIDLAGDMAPQIALGGPLTVLSGDWVLDGSFGFSVVLGASEFVSGPLWAASEPCPSPPWAESEPCPPSMWTPIGPCDPVAWKKSELCNG